LTVALNAFFAENLLQVIRKNSGKQMAEGEGDCGSRRGGYARNDGRRTSFIDGKTLPLYPG